MEQMSTVVGGRTCRICLRNRDNSHSLYDLVEYEEGDELELKELFKRVAGVDIAINDTLLPTRICSQCTDKLLEAYEFMVVVDKSEELLREYLCEVSRGQKAEEEEVIVEVKEAEDVEEATSSAEEDSDNKDGEDNGDDVESMCFEFLDADYQELMHEEDTVVTITTPPEDNPIVVDVTEHPEEETEEDQDGRNDNAQITANATNDSVDHRQSRYKLGSRLGNYETSSWRKCSKCQRTFAKKETLDKHIRIAHTYAPIEMILAAAPKPTPEQPLQCSKCPRIFMRKDNMQRHMQAMHPDTVTSDEQQKPTKKHIYKRGLCPFCGESFSQASLLIHIRRHTGETPYKCTECGKGYPRRQDLVVHQRQHSGEKPLVCTICGKTFVRPNKLSRHMRIHTGVRPYKCTECDKSFSQSNDLKLHLRRHTGEKPYKCDVCDEAFISGTALKKHRMQKQHHEQYDIKVDPYAKVRVNNRPKPVDGMSHEG